MKNIKNAEGPQSLRLTFEDCIHFQGVLLGYLEKVIDENRAMHPDERDQFLESVSRALFGDGKRIPGGLILNDSDSSEGVLVETAEDLLRLLAFSTSTVFTDDDGSEFTIGEVWKMARKLVLGSFPAAIKKAIAVSFERFMGGPDRRPRGYEGMELHE